MVMVRVTAGLPLVVVMVIVAVRVVVEVFAARVIMTVLFPEPVEGDSVTQVALEEALQLALAVTVTYV